jgi:hypothetical protein
MGCTIVACSTSAVFAEYNEFRHPVQRYAATECMLCRHSIGCRVSVQNLIRAEDVRGRFELGQNSVLQECPRSGGFYGAE